MQIRVGARQSPLAKAQAEEVLKELQHFQPQVTFTHHWLATYGDIDRQQSLRALDKTDFFTREIDMAVLAGICDIGIHSAKDLPEPLAEGLAIAALTEGVDSSDVLVLRSGANLESLPFEALIACSSTRREKEVRRLRADLTFRDVRGTIAERLALVEKGDADGLVVAKAALIRLGLNHLNEIPLPGETTPLQGKLAVVAREDNMAMQKLFACLDIRENSWR